MKTEHRTRWSVRVEFKVADLWVGLYWRRLYVESWPGREPDEDTFDLWICLVPMCPLHIRRVVEIPNTLRSLA